MHVAPADYRSVRRDGVMLHFALLDSKAWVVAEFPESGSSGTFAELTCEQPHWGLVISGDVDLHLDRGRQSIAPGTAFHVPANVPHHVVAGARARVAGLEPLPADVGVDERSLRDAGFEVARSPSRSGPRAVSVVQPRPARQPAPGEIVAESRRMGDLLLTRTRLGRRAGYTTEPCDLPHWGVVTLGSIAIEWEDDVEVVGPGDVFHCPAGPPGHRLEAAEAASIIDFTPVAALEGGGRVAGWRAKAAATALRETSGVDVVRLDLAALG